MLCTPTLVKCLLRFLLPLANMSNLTQMPKTCVLPQAARCEILHAGGYDSQYKNGEVAVASLSNSPLPCLPIVNAAVLGHPTATAERMQLPFPDCPLYLLRMRRMKKLLAGNMHIMTRSLRKVIKRMLKRKIRESLLLKP